MQPNPNLLTVHRIAESMRERTSYVRLDRNERVTPFTPDEFAPMVAAIQPEMFCSYPDPSPLVDRLAASLDIPSDWICLTNGSDAAIRKVFQTFLRDRDTVLLPEPTYAMYPIYARMFGAATNCVSYRRDRTLDLSLFLEQLSASPRIAALACPDQPTGAVLAPDAIRRVAECAQRHDVLLVIDEAYYPFYPLTAVQLTRDFKNVVVTRTFSKVGGLAGLRFGYFVADPEVVGLVERVRGAHEVNAVAIQVGCHLTDHPEIGARFVRDIEAGRAELVRSAAELGFGCPPSPANFQLIELPPALDPREVTAALKERGYLVKGGFDHPSVERCIRVTLAGPDVIGPFADALKKVCARVSDVPLDSVIAGEQRAWSSPESLEYYRRRRQSAQDLYPSERFFLPDAVRRSKSMLDVGCAAGGFSIIVKGFNPTIRYVGVDVTPEFVEAARVDHPDAEFLVGDGVHFGTPPGTFDLVHASGVLHLNQHFGEIIRAMWQQAGRYLLCDLRLTSGESEVGQMVSPFNEPQAVTLPYVVLKVDEALGLFKGLEPAPASIRVKGYPQRASGAARLANPDIVMAFFLLEKALPAGGGSRPTLIEIDLNAG